MLFFKKKSEKKKNFFFDFFWTVLICNFFIFFIWILYTFLHTFYALFTYFFDQKCTLNGFKLIKKLLFVLSFLYTFLHIFLKKFFYTKKTHFLHFLHFFTLFSRFWSKKRSVISSFFHFTNPPETPPLFDNFYVFRTLKNT